MVNLIKNRCKFFKNIFIAITCLCVLNLLPKKLMSPAQQIQAEAQREGIHEVNLMENELSNGSDLYTQTQAHEHIKRMRELIQDNFKDQVVPYFNIISRMVTKEAELKDTHYVFYHACATIVAIMSDLFTQLYFYEHPEAKAADDTFRFLRYQGQSTDLSARAFVEKELRAHGLIDDKTQALMAILLSVNLSLFGNVGSTTESTWLRFIDNRRSLEKWQQDEFETMMDKFGLTKKYVKDIMALDDILSVTPEAMLLQICIPKKLVDELVYLAWIRGLPAAGPIMEWIKDYQSSPTIEERNRGHLEHIQASREKLTEIFQKEQEKNPIFRKFMEDLQGGKFSTYAYLRAYCNKPSEVPYLNDTAGRILFTKEGLLNPVSGIEVYSYFSTPREKFEEYTNKLNAIVEKLIAEKESKKSVASKPISMTAPKPKPMPKPTVKPVPLSARQRPIIR